MTTSAPPKGINLGAPGGPEDLRDGSARSNLDLAAEAVQEEYPQAPPKPRSRAAIENEQKRMILVARCLYKCVLVRAPKGRGKSLLMVALSYQMRELFHKHIVVVGTSLGLNRKLYGEFTFMSATTFIKKLALFNELADAENDDGELSDETLESDRVRHMLMEMGLIDGVLVIDESYRLFDAAHRNKMARAFGYFMSAVRHYLDTVLIAAPSKRMVDNRVRDQIDYTVEVSNQCQTWKGPHGLECIVPGCMHLFEAIFRNDNEQPFKMIVWGPQYQPMYNTLSTVGFNESAISSKGLE